MVWAYFFSYKLFLLFFPSLGHDLSYDSVSIYLMDLFFFCSETLYRQGQGALETLDLEDALADFIDWLESLGGELISPQNN